MIKIKATQWEEPDFGLVFATIAVAATILVGTITVANAAMSRNEVSKKMTEDFGVKVLRVKPMNDAGRHAYEVTVMSPGGDRNGAFQVNTIVIDANTGKPVIQYGHEGGQQHWPAPPVSHRTHPRSVAIGSTVNSGNLRGTTAQ